MSLRTSTIREFRAATGYYAKHSAKLPELWRGYVKDKDKHDLDALEDTVAAFKSASISQAEVYESGCEDLESVGKSYEDANQRSIFNLARYFYDSPKAETNAAIETAQVRYGIGFASLAELNGDSSPEFLEILDLYTTTFSTMEIRLLPQKELGVFTRTFCDMAACNASKELLERYSNNCLDFLGEGLPIQDLSDAFLYYAIYLRVPDEYRLRVKFDTLQNEIKELTDLVKEDHVSIKSEERQKKWEDTKSKLLRYSTYSNIGKLIGFTLLEILSRL